MATFAEETELIRPVMSAMILMNLSFVRFGYLCAFRVGGAGWVLLGEDHADDALQVGEIVVRLVFAETDPDDVVDSRSLCAVLRSAEEFLAALHQVLDGLSDEFALEEVFRLDRLFELHEDFLDAAQQVLGCLAFGFDGDHLHQDAEGAGQHGSWVVVFVLEAVGVDQVLLLAHEALPFDQSDHRRLRVDHLHLLNGRFLHHLLRACRQEVAQSEVRRLAELFLCDRGVRLGPMSGLRGESGPFRS